MKRMRPRSDGNTPQRSRPLVAPLDLSVAYETDGPDDLDDIYEGREAGYTYAREGHPNAARLALALDRMEGMERGVVTGSGMAAVSAVLMGLTRSGDHVIGGNQLYGRSLRLMNEDLPRLGVHTTLVDPTRPPEVAAALRDNTRLVLIEVVSNPTLRIADLKAIAELTHEAGALLVVDNTFTTPRGLRPLEFGADIVLHSVTKLLAGHSDVTLGWVAARDPAISERLAVFGATMGLTASPFDCWLAERGLLSFPLRYDRAEANAAALADTLGRLPGVRRVLYPGRSDHPDHDTAAALLNGRFGNMVSFEIDGGREAASRLVASAPELAFAPTLGDVTTTLSHPPSSSHRSMNAADRAALGISEGFFRVSVGIEDPDHLISAFTRAVSAATS